MDNFTHIVAKAIGHVTAAFVLIIVATFTVQNVRKLDYSQSARDTLKPQRISSSFANNNLKNDNLQELKQLFQIQ